MTTQVERPKLGIMRFVQLPEISPSIGLLPAIAEANWTDEKYTPEQLLEKIRQGEIWMWHLEGVESGLALLRIEETDEHKSLVLYGLAGENVVSKGQAIAEDLQTVARFYQCDRIETVAHDLRWNFVAKRLGFEIAYVVYRQGVN